MVSNMKAYNKFNFDEYNTFCIIMQIKPCYYKSLLEFKEFIKYASTL